MNEFSVYDYIREQLGVDLPISTLKAQPLHKLQVQQRDLRKVATLNGREVATTATAADCDDLAEIPVESAEFYIQLLLTSSSYVFLITDLQRTWIHAANEAEMEAERKLYAAELRPQSTAETLSHVSRLLLPSTDMQERQRNQHFSARLVTEAATAVTVTGAAEGAAIGSRPDNVHLYLDGSVMLGAYQLQWHWRCKPIAPLLSAAFIRFSVIDALLSLITFQSFMLAQNRGSSAISSSNNSSSNDNGNSTLMTSVQQSLDANYTPNADWLSQFDFNNHVSAELSMAQQCISNMNSTTTLSADQADAGAAVASPEAAADMKYTFSAASQAASVVTSQSAPSASASATSMADESQREELSRLSSQQSANVAEEARKQQLRERLLKESKTKRSKFK